MADEIMHHLQQVLSYDPITGIFLWKDGDKAGTRAGYVLKAGYRRIPAFGQKFYEHRLAWLFSHGKWPEKNIDHLNGDRADNRLANLRDVSQALNMQNTRKARGAAGLIGVCACRDKYRAEIRIDGKKKHLGVFMSAEEAHDAYIQAKRQHHSCWQ